ncbi:MAG: hypothetical protein E7324_07525 [Clostridiales bacterium]|nr:hypothetical protein [Clostridiales bacterium]
MIATGQVMITLQPWLGVRLSRQMEGLMEDLARQMNLYSSRYDPDDLARQLDSRLFCAVRDLTKCTMLAEMEEGIWIRIQVEDFAMMADELMLLIFQQFPVDAAHFMLLQEYSMRCASLSALRVLYTRFSSLQSPQELNAIASVIRSCHPSFRWREWLD